VLTLGEGVASRFALGAQLGVDADEVRAGADDFTCWDLLASLSIRAPDFRTK